MKKLLQGVIGVLWIGEKRNANPRDEDLEMFVFDNCEALRELEVKSSQIIMSTVVVRAIWQGGKISPAELREFVLDQQPVMWGDISSLATPCEFKGSIINESMCAVDMVSRTIDEHPCLKEVENIFLKAKERYELIEEIVLEDIERDRIFNALQGATLRDLLRMEPLEVFEGLPEECCEDENFSPLDNWQVDMINNRNNLPIETRVLVDESINFRDWRLSLIFFKDKPVAVVQEAGRSWKDHGEILVVDRRIWNRMIKKMIESLLLELKETSDNDVSDDNDYVSTFYGRKLVGNKLVPWNEASDIVEIKTSA